MVTTSDFITTTLDPALIHRSEELYTKKEFNKHTVKKDGIGQIEGNIGELFFEDYCKRMGWPIRKADQIFDYDFILGGCTIDVKTKLRESLTIPSQEFSVPYIRRDAEVDIYVGLNVTKNYPRRIQLLGFISKEEFMSLCYYVPTGRKPNGAKIGIAMNNIINECLHPITDLFNFVHKENIPSMQMSTL